MLLIAVSIFIFCAMNIFSFEKEAALEVTSYLNNDGRSLYYAGVVTQIYWLYIIQRDIAMFIGCFLCEGDFPEPRNSLVKTLRFRD